MTNLTLQEQETILTMSADDRGTWHVFCDDVVMQKRLERIGATLIRPATNGIGKFYELRANQISFRKGKIQLSDEERARRSARMRALKAQQKLEA